MVVVVEILFRVKLKDDDLVSLVIYHVVAFVGVEPDDQDFMLGWETVLDLSSFPTTCSSYR